jgi:hypothetical protein
MSAYDDGGPAYPVAPHSEDDGVTMISRPGHPGMSLRDWFAGKALANGWRQMFTDPDEGVSYEDIARYCFEMAEAMMAERERRYGKQPEPEAEGLILDR